MKVSVAALALGALAVSPAFAGPPAPAKHIHRVYDVMRKGSQIGTETVDVTRQGDKSDVKITSHILVKIAFITAYRYDHNESESWKGKQLVAFKSSTNDNGTAHEVKATQAGNKIAMTVDGAASAAPKAIVPASLWSAEVCKQSQLFDPANGKRMAVTVESLGPETVELNGAPHQLQHIKLSGEYPRDLWFDDDGLVKMSMLGPDNSEVTSELRQSTAAN